MNMGQIKAIMCIEMFDWDYDQMLCGLDVPILFVDGPAKRSGRSLPADQLYMDNTTEITRFVNDMLEKGFTKIGFVGNYDHCQSFFERYTAFYLTMLIAGQMDKKGVFIILIPAFFFAAFGMTCIGIGQSLGMMLAAGLFKALGQGSGTPSLQAYCVKTLDKSRAGVASSTILIGQSIGNAVSPIVGSFVVKASGYKVLFLGAGAIVLLNGLILLMFQRTPKKAASRGTVKAAINCLTAGLSPCRQFSVSKNHSKAAGIRTPKSSCFPKKWIKSEYPGQRMILTALFFCVRHRRFSSAC